MIGKMTDFLGELFNGLFSRLSVAIKQTTASYCELQTADSPTVLVTNDGSLLSVLRLSGTTSLVGVEEFERTLLNLQQSLQTAMSQPGHVMQVYFNYNRDEIQEQIKEILNPAKETAARLSLKLDDLFRERIHHLANYCAHEEVYIVLWTRLKSLTSEQISRSRNEKQKTSRY